jgi:acetyl-CoA C-acetyltransferase
MQKNVLKKLFSFKNVVIVAAKRTPIGSLMGSLSEVHATSLGAVAIKGAMKQAKLNSDEIDEVILGNVVSSGIGQAPARQAAIKAGLSVNTVCTTVNKVCSSGMKSVTLGSQSISLGISKTVVTGGFESMSNIPHYASLRKGISYGNAGLVDGIMFDGLMDPYDKVPMGTCAEKTAKEFSISREEQDNYCKLSYERARKANFSDEIEPVEIQNSKTKKLEAIKEDDEPKKYMPDKITSLKPAFDKDGTITAANASKINDGGCAIILMEEELAKSKKLQPLARIIGYQDAEINPVDFGKCPSVGIMKLLKKHQLDVSNISAFEINEAFSVVALANAKILGIKQDQLNINGGAVALGHPIGVSGARIIVALMKSLVEKNGKFGVASICNGGGGSTSILIENLRF